MTMTRFNHPHSINAAFLHPNDEMEIVEVEVNICDRCKNLHIFFKNDAGQRIAGFMIGALSAEALALSIDKAILALLAIAPTPEPLQ